MSFWSRWAHRSESRTNHSKQIFQRRLTNAQLSMSAMTIPAMPRLRRSDSGASTGSRSSIASKSKSKRRGVQRSVSFGEERTRQVEAISHEDRNDVWYTKKELDHLNKKEIKRNLITQLNILERNSSITLESKELTWRGLEDVEKENERKTKIEYYVKTVVFEHKQDTNPSELKRIAKSLSKEERNRAQQMGVMDEMTAHGGKRADPILAKRKAGIGRTLSGSLNWVKKQTSSSSKKESAQAA